MFNYNNHNIKPSKARLYLLISLGLASFILISLTALTLIIDPLQFMRRASFYPAQFSLNQRYQNPGLIHNYPYDSILLGSSLTELFHSSYMDENLEGHWLRLSLSGATAHELDITLNTAIETEKLERIMIGMYWWTYARENSNDTRFGAENFPYYLYNRHNLSWLHYAFNLDNVKASLRIALINSLTDMSQRRNLDNLNNWSRHFTFNTETVESFFNDHVSRESHNIAPNMPATAGWTISLFEETMRPHIENNPNIHFDLILYPYSYLYYELQRRSSPQKYEAILAFRRYVIDELGQFPNTTIHDFSREENIIGNLNNYKDTHHFSEEIANRLIEDIAAGTNIIEAGNGMITEAELEITLNQIRANSSLQN